MTAVSGRLFADGRWGGLSAANVGICPITFPHPTSLPLQEIESHRAFEEILNSQFPGLLLICILR